MSDLSVENRATNLKKLAGDFFDIVIIGGGITGAGTARDAASRGLKVGLIEARDFAVGTSSRSSKLIHGGIRYLEQREFGLVFEALSERQNLFDIAPHLVHPLRFIIPLYKKGRVGMTMMGLGMWLYDVLSLWEAPELHSRLDLEEVAEKLPFLNTKELLGAYAYSDAYMDDDRLVFETMRSATALGATCASYVKAIGAEFGDDGKMTAAIAQDARTGKKLTIRARHFVSTVGPWTDALGEHLFKTWKKILRPAKGVHLTFHRERLPLHDAVVMAAEERIVFGIPRHDMVIVGTTDTDFKGDPYDVRADDADVDYLLGVTDQYFPGARVTRADIVSAYAGVRPLVDDQSQTESKTSREHLILNDPRGVTFVAGGKYTTYRHMAEQTVEAVLSQWDLGERGKFSRAQTLEPLNPKVTRALLDSARTAASVWAREFSLDARVTESLADRHGMEARDILTRSLGVVREAHPSTMDEINAGLEALHAIEQTMCMTLTDFVFRRTHLFLAERDHGAAVWPFISRIMGDRLGWSDAERLEQLNALQKQIRFELDWRR